VVGRARGLMETRGSWISGKSLQGGAHALIKLGQASLLLPGFFPLAPRPATLPTQYHKVIDEIEAL